METKERVKVSGPKLLDTIKQLISRGDARRVCLIQEERSILEIPLNVGDPAAPATVLAAPVLAAIKAFSTLVNDCTVEVEKIPPKRSRTRLKV